MNICIRVLIWFVVSFGILYMDLPISWAKECRAINIVITDADNNILGSEEGIVIKTQYILLSEHIVKIWLSHLDNELKINPSFERLKEIYFTGLIPEYNILARVDDSVFLNTRSFAQKTSPFSKCIEIRKDLKSYDSVLLKELEEKWSLKNNINEDLERIVKRYLFFAESEIERNDYKSAMEDLQKIIQIWPWHYEAWRKLAVLYSKIDDTEKAKEAFIMTLRINPFQKDLYINYGTMMLSRKNYGSALNALRKAYFLYPHDPKVVYHYGIISFLNGDMELAKSLEKKLLRLDKDLARNLSQFLQ